MFSEASGASLNHLQEEAHKCNSDNHKYPYCVIESHKPISPRAYCVSSPPYCAEESYKALHLYPYSVSSHPYCVVGYNKPIRSHPYCVRQRPYCV